MITCGNFRGIKLLEHWMKMIEKIVERRLIKLITVNNMQLGFDLYLRRFGKKSVMTGCPGIRCIAV